METYKSIAEMARAHGVTRMSAGAWLKKASWTQSGLPLSAPFPKEKADSFIAGNVRSHRRGKQRRPNPSEAQKVGVAVDQKSLEPTRSVIPASEIETASLEDLERMIRQCRNSDQAETLSKQVRSLKVVQEIAEREGKTINAELARAEIRAVLQMFRTAFCNLPRQIAHNLEGLPAAEIETVMEGRITELVGELKRGLCSAIKSEDVAGGEGFSDSTGEAAAKSDSGKVQDVEPPTEQQAGQMGQPK